MTVDGKMANFLSATSYVEDSELIPDEMNVIIFSQNSLNVATPVATEAELHTDTLFVYELNCVFPNPYFCARCSRQNK